MVLAGNKAERLLSVNHTTKQFINIIIINVENTSKSHITPNKLQYDIMLFDVSWIIYIRFSTHMQKEEYTVNTTGAA